MDNYLRSGSLHEDIMNENEYASIDELDMAKVPLLPVSERMSTPSRRKIWCTRQRIAIIICIILLILILLYIIISTQVDSIAAGTMKATDMTIHSMKLTNPTNDSIALTLDLTIKSPSMFSATIAPAIFTISHETFGTVGSFQAPLMDVSFGRNEQKFNNVQLNVTNSTAWDAFAQGMIKNEYFSYNVESVLDLKIHLFGFYDLHANSIPLKKNMEIQAMNGLSTMEIAELDMTKSTSSAVIAKIKTCLLNPSNMILEPVGKICMKTYAPDPKEENLVANLRSLEEVKISVKSDDPSHPYCAKLSTEEKDMSMGYNLLELEGEMLGTNSKAIGGLISKYLSGTPAPITVTACPGEASSISLYNKAMESLRIATLLPPSKDMLIGSMFFNTLTLAPPVKGQENNKVQIQTSVIVEAASPLGPNSPLSLSDIGMTVSLRDNDKNVLGELRTLSVDIMNGTLIEKSNISVNCETELKLDNSGKAFGVFVRDSIKSDKVSLSLDGTISVTAAGALGNLKLAGIPIHVVTQLDGMQNFNKVTVDGFQLPGDVTKVGETIDTQITVWNPSLFNVSIGTLGMDLKLKSGEKMGELQGEMNLQPGTNHLKLNGLLSPQVDDKKLVNDKVAMFFSKYLRGEDSMVSVTITKLAYENCVWMQQALLGLSIETKFNGAPSDFQLISDISIKQLDAVFQESDSKGNMLVKTDLEAIVKMPSNINIPIDIKSVSIGIQLESQRSEKLGLLMTDREATKYDGDKGGLLRLNMEKLYAVTMKSAEERKNMAGFITDLVTSNKDVMMRLKSNRLDSSEGAFPYVDTRMGILSLVNIPTEGAPLISPMNSFKDPPIEIEGIDILHGNADNMDLYMTFSITNPSIVNTKLGDISLDVMYNGKKMGTASIKSFELKCCGEKSKLAGAFLFAPEDKGAAREFLSNFVSGYYTNGESQEITIQGSPQSTKIDILAPALQSLKIATKLPTLKMLFPDTPTLVKASMLYTPSIFSLKNIPTALELRNPFSEEITITSARLSLIPCQNQRTNEAGDLVCDQYFSEPLADFTPEKFEPIKIPKGETSGCYNCCQGLACEKRMKLCPSVKPGKCMAATVDSFLSPEAISAIFHSATTGLLMLVKGTVTTSIGSYTTELMYQQNDLFVKMTT